MPGDLVCSVTFGAAVLLSASQALPPRGNGLNNLVTIGFNVRQAWVVVSNPFDLIGEL